MTDQYEQEQIALMEKHLPTQAFAAFKARMEKTDKLEQLVEYQKKTIIEAAERDKLQIEIISRYKNREAELERREEMVKKTADAQSFERHALAEERRLLDNRMLRRDIEALSHEVAFAENLLMALTKNPEFKKTVVMRGREPQQVGAINVPPGGYVPGDNKGGTVYVEKTTEETRKVD